MLVAFAVSRYSPEYRRLKRKPAIAPIANGVPKNRARLYSLNTRTVITIMPTPTATAGTTLTVVVQAERRSGRSAGAGRSRRGALGSTASTSIKP